MNREALEHALAVLRDYMAPLQPYVEDPLVQEIKVNSGSNVWVERAGTSFKADEVHIADSAVTSVIKTLANVNTKTVSRILDCRLPGLRIAAAQSPVAIHGSALCIRKHAQSNMRLADYVERGIFEVLPAGTPRSSQQGIDCPDLAAVRRGGPALAEFLSWIVKTRKNVLITGATSSGKTTLMNALIAEIPETERVISIEDTAELQIALPDYVGFECAQDVAIRDLVRLSLRFAPTRILVGECRGPEAYDLLSALYTGHYGFVTYHANSSEEALPRLEGMVRQSEEGKSWPLADLRQQIASTFQYIIHAAREYGVRGPMEIREMLGAQGGAYQTRLIYSKVQLEDHPNEA